MWGRNLKLRTMKKTQLESLDNGRLFRYDVGERTVPGMFGEKVRSRREELGYTQEEVAALINEELSRQAVSRWENSEAYPEVEKLLILSTILDVSLDVLFSDGLAETRKVAEEPNTMADYESNPNKYPGLVAGLTAFSEALRRIEQGGESNERTE